MTAMPEEDGGARRNSMMGGVPSSVCRISMHGAGADLHQITGETTVNTTGVDCDENDEEEERPIIRGEVVGWREVEASLGSQTRPQSLKEAFESLCDLAPDILAGLDVNLGGVELVRRGGVEAQMNPPVKPSS